jgi:hypothetical protein
MEIPLHRARDSRIQSYGDQKLIELIIPSSQRTGRWQLYLESFLTLKADIFKGPTRRLKYFTRQNGFDIFRDAVSMTG